VTLALKKSVPLPANATLKVGQKSLLGAEYVEVDDPAGRPFGQLGGGAVIPLRRTGHYPETEEVLAATSLVLSNGGLAQIKDITTELDSALGGPAQQRAARELIPRLRVLLGNLDRHKQQIVGLVAALNRLGGTLARERSDVATAIDHLDPGLRLLNVERGKLLTAVRAVGRFSAVGTRVITEAGDDLAGNVAALGPVLTQLRAAGSALPESLNEIGTLPFPLQTIDRAFRGDYANVFVTLDLTLPQLLADFVGGPAAPGASLGPAHQAKNPITAPLHPRTAGAPGPSKSRAPAQPSAAPSPTPSPTGSPTPSPTGPRCNLLQALLGGC
jgi:phospholipid/cholesterol/gamma-HCH transport system substrate-binding protein